MQRAIKETIEHSEQPHAALEKHVARLTDELQHLAQNGDWEAIKSVFRVLNAHARAKELRAQGQPARAHLWLVGVGRKRQKLKAPKKTTTPQPAA